MPFRPLPLGSLHRYLTVSICFVLTAAGLVTSRAVETQKAKTLPPAATKTIDYARDIEPILTSRCATCHGEKKQESSFRVDRRDALLHGGNSGEPAVLSGHSDQSRLIKFVARLDPDTVMPPEGKPLSNEQIALVRAWIDQGLKMPDAVHAPAAASLWSLEPLKNAPPPVIRDPWIANPIDAFVLEKLHAAGLAPSPQADRVSLIRRVYLDTIGLPPTPDEIDRFVRDRDPKAYERLVDNVLASPHYGECWARHWLDVIRFADTDGYENNAERPNAYRFRDYLIRAFNEDRPWDRMVVEQLAGDAVGEDAATGFLVGGGVDRVKSPNILLTRTQRQDELSDMIGTTSTAFLGLTVGCARCHDHKFDPIPQRDFYALQAVFAGVRHEQRPLLFANGKPVNPPERPAVADSKRPAINARLNEERFAATPALAVRFTVSATNDGAEPCIDELEVYEPGPKAKARNVALASAGATATSSGNYQNNPRHKLEHINDGKYGNDRSWISNERGRGWVQINFQHLTTVNRIVWQRDRQRTFIDRLPTTYKIELLRETGQWTKVASSSDHATSKPKPSQAMTYGGRFDQPETTYRLNRGDPMQPREAVAADALTALRPLLGSLDQKLDAPEQQRRLALAHWIARSDNPLTARVIVNRLWHYHFGAGIVASPSDFGHMGTPPSHPELLDWLAGELIRNGWRLKQVHRLILLSSAYRQADEPNPRGLAADASDRLLWRFAPRRLDAEAIRDSILASSGALDLKMYGPGFSAFEPNSNYVRVYKPRETWGQDEFRRMVYMTKVRREPDAVFGAFDSPDAGQVCPKRSRSTTPLQALNLLNSSFLVEQSALLATRVAKEAKPEARARVERAFLLTLGRLPHADEALAGMQLVEKHGLESLCRALYNANEFLFLP